jgi:hypothetical protein
MIIKVYKGPDGLTGAAGVAPAGRVPISIKFKMTKMTFFNIGNRSSKVTKRHPKS